MNAASSTSWTVTVGIDLASQPKDTAACAIEWSAGLGRVVTPSEGPWTDEALLALTRADAVTKVGIDAPFGWPLGFIDAISSFRDSGEWLALDANELRFRATEQYVWNDTGRVPLSVATDSLVWPTIRCASLLSKFRSDGGPLDRSGRGLVAEVYPMAALLRWGVIASQTSPQTWSYKADGPGRRDRRVQHLARLRELLDGSVEMSSADVERFVDDDDDFDALISALVARCAELELTDRAAAGMHWRALREGWIQLPAAGSLSQLAPSAPVG